MTKRKRKGYRRRISVGEKKRWNYAAELLLADCEHVLHVAQGFDTAVRDSIASGLAYLVHAAFDCRCIALGFKNFESMNAFIDNSTAEWFRTGVC